jgi:aflatoxin B1 aldehyde reductase
MPHSQHSGDSHRVKVVLGTALFGDAADPQAKFNTTEEAKKVLDIFRARGYAEIDTARGYPVGAPGTSEKLLGTVNDGNWMKLDTKVVSWTPGSHLKANIKTSVDNSLEALKTTKVRSPLPFPIIQRE